MVPNVTVSDHPAVDIPEGMPVKASKDGYYVNPFGAASSLFETSRRAIRSGCITLSDEEKKSLIDFAQYFYKTAIVQLYESSKFVVWPYPINYTYGLKPGWISGMAQAYVAVVVAAASTCSKSQDAKKFAEFASFAIASLEVPVEYGGVLVKVKGGNWYEEYAQPGIVPPLVLNGHIYVLLALDALRYFDARAQSLLSTGIQAVLGNIERYDGVTWSYYDSVGTPANNVYQQSLHTWQMKQLYEMTGNAVFFCNTTEGFHFSDCLLSRRCNG